MTLNGSDITRLREMTGLSANQFRRLIGVSEATYYRWIQNKFSPNTPTCRLIMLIVLIYKTEMIDRFRPLLDLEPEIEPDKTRKNRGD